MTMKCLKAQRLLATRRGTIITLESTLETLFITGLGVGARLLSSTTCALVKNVVLVNSILLVTLCKMLVGGMRWDKRIQHTKLSIRIGNLAVVVLGAFYGRIVLENADLALAGA